MPARGGAGHSGAPASTSEPLMVFNLPAPLNDRHRPRLERVFIGWALVVVISLLSFYVHLLNSAVARGEQLRLERCAQRAATLGTPSAACPR